eukprot:9489158-Pyramimonas_sp.AAC.2
MLTARVHIRYHHHARLQAPALLDRVFYLFFLNVYSALGTLGEITVDTGEMLSELLGVRGQIESLLLIVTISSAAAAHALHGVV